MQVVLELLYSCIVWRSTVDTFQGSAPQKLIFGWNRPCLKVTKCGIADIETGYQNPAGILTAGLCTGCIE